MTAAAKAFVVLIAATQWNHFSWTWMKMESWHFWGQLTRSLQILLLWGLEALAESPGVIGSEMEYVPHRKLSWYWETKLHRIYRRGDAMKEERTIPSPQSHPWCTWRFAGLREAHGPAETVSLPECRNHKSNQSRRLRVKVPKLDVTWGSKGIVPRLASWQVVSCDAHFLAQQLGA